MKRRDFLKRSTLLTGAAVMTPYFFGQTERTLAQQAPSDRLRMGCIGVGSMGLGDAFGFNGLVDIVALCDVDTKYGLERSLNSGIGKKNEKGETIKPEAYTDYRRVLDRNDIDVVSVVTPDHWHTKIAIEALMAGKHVFCQKPLTLTLEENQLIRAACKKYDKTFQVGTQQRSQYNEFMTASLIIQKGFLGKIRKIVCDIGASNVSNPLPKCDPPESLDWNMWLGQAPYTDYLASDAFESDGIPSYSRCHRVFRWWYEYSGGKFTDWGAHHIDSALWALGLQEEGTGPISFDGTNSKHPVPYKDGYPTVDNQYNTCNEFDIVCLLENGCELHVVSSSPDGNGVLFEGTQGKIHVNRERIKGKVMDEKVQETFTQEDYQALYKGKPLEGHKENFIRCIREGGLPVSDVFSHVQAMNCCHLCGISARLGRKIQWNPKTEEIVGDELAASFFSREQRKGFEIPR